MRITDDILQAKIDALNSLTLSPQTPWTRHPETGKLTANVGAHYLGHANGGANVCRLANAAGGVTTPLGNYHRPRRELAEAIDNYMTGYRAASTQH